VKRPHDRYEALAGAILLGEASPAERAEFALHAEGCAVCREDATAFATPIRELVENAASSETWRPSMTGEIVSSIQERHSKRTRFAITTIGYAIAASIALNVAFVSGFGGRALDAMRVTPNDNFSVSQRIRLEHRPKPVTIVAAASAPAGPRRSKVAALRAHAGKVTPDVTAADEVESPDVFAGLTADGNGARSVASEFPQACDTDLEGVSLRPEPCRPMPADRRH
jgi:hypothetical protein